MESIESQRESVIRAIAALEGQRSSLGDAVVDTALASLREKLAALQPEPAAEQRKQVTVLFADLVGFTAMSEAMDPEDMRELMNAYFSRWTAAVEYFGGVVEKFIGDAVMAVFGIQIANEADPENAIRAALKMREQLAQLAGALPQSQLPQPLRMRVGIHTGPVVVSWMGERKGQDFVVVGDTVNTASRLQSLAPVDGILISRDTYRLVRGLFEVQAAEPMQAKGKRDPLQGYLVMQEKPRAFGETSRGIEGVETIMVGRQAEVAHLQGVFQKVVESGECRMVTVVGEAGLGKSRLLREFDRWLEGQLKNAFFKGRSSPIGQKIPYGLLHDMFANRCVIRDSDLPQVVRANLEAEIGETLGSPALSVTQESAHFIARLLGFEIGSSSFIPAADPLQIRERGLAFLSGYFQSLAQKIPLVIELEDVHWADDSSLDLLVRLAGMLQKSPILFLCAARPTLLQHRPDWGQELEFAELLRLAPLTAVDSQLLVENILRNVAELPADLSNLVVTRAEGNPFFIEEVIKMISDAEVIFKGKENWTVDLAQLANLQIPATLVEVLQARLDNLSHEERLLLQRASVLGKVFWDAAIGFMDQGLEDKLQISPLMVEVLMNLSAKEMVFLHPASVFENIQEFQFKHALLRDVTYESALKRLRKIYHAYAAAWLEMVTAQIQRSNEYAAMIAEHFERAGDWQKARAWYSRAGIQAADIYANAEAVRCFTRCLENTPESDAAGRFEVIVKRARLYDSMANRPAQKRDLEAAQLLAVELDQIEPSAARRAQVCLQWWHYFEAIGELQVSIQTAQQAIDLAVTVGEKKSEASGHLYLGATYWKQANYAVARQHLEQALALARAIGQRTLEADSLRNLGVILQYQGNFAAASAHYQNALRLYKEESNERGESMTLNSLGSLLVDQANYRQARPYFERSLELKRKVGHRRAEHITMHNLGVLASRVGDYAEAFNYLEQVERFYAETGDREGQGEALLALANNALYIGDQDRAKTCVEAAVEIAHTEDNRAGECEIKLAQAFLAHRQGSYQAAHQASQEALALAREFKLADEEIHALCLAGHALLSQGRDSEASESYRRGLDLAKQRGSRRLFPELQAGSARVALAQNQPGQALQIVDELLTQLRRADERQEIDAADLDGMEEPFWVLLTCCQALQAANDPRTEDILRSALRLLQDQAARLADETARRSFLANVPAHRALMAWGEAV